MKFLHVNPFILTSAAGGPITLSEPWGEVARQETVSGGVLTLSGLDLSRIKIMELHINGTTVTTDDSTLGLQLIIAGSTVNSGYRWAHTWHSSAAGASENSSASDSSIALTGAGATRGVGNASTAAFRAVVTIYNPTSAQHKRVFVRSSYKLPAGGVGGINYGGGQLNNSSAITGFVVTGSSNLTGGSIIALGVE